MIAEFSLLQRLFGKVIVMRSTTVPTNKCVVMAGPAAYDHIKHHLNEERSDDGKANHQQEEG
jgi:hypothetical protein